MALIKNESTPILSGDEQIGTYNSETTQRTDGSSIKAKRAPQLAAALIACLSPLSMGIVLGYSSPTLMELIDSGILTKDQGTWFGSLSTVGAIIGGPIAAVFVELLGRKTSLMLINLPYVIGWCIIIFSEKYWLMYIGRFITGIAMGATSLATPLYIAEVVSKELRGFLGAAFQLTVVIGILFSYAFGIFLDYKWLAISAAVFPTIMVLSMIWAPETPRWFLSKRMRTQALEALKRLRGPDFDVDEECIQIETNLEGQTGARLAVGDYLQRGVLRPLALSAGLMFFQQFSGVNAVIFYSQSILATAGFQNNPETAAVIVAAVQVVATFVSCLLMDVAGRRILLFIAGSFMAVSSCGLGLYYFLSHSLSWLSLLSLVVYIIAFSLGWGPIPWLIMSEILPTRVKGVASGIATCLNWTCAFIVTKEFHDLQVAITPYGTFWAFGGICFLGVVFVAIFIPETKGKSLEEIEEHFGRVVSS